MLIDFMNNRTTHVLSSVSLATLLLASCGGGGGGDSSTATGGSTGSGGSTGAPVVSLSDEELITQDAKIEDRALNDISAAAKASTKVAPYGQNASDYVLTFSQSFNSGFNTNLWNDHIWYQTGNPTKNYTVEGGVLKIWPQRDANNTFFNRTIDTDGKFSQKYGYFEIEAKLPIGKGTRPGFLLFNHLDTRRPGLDVMQAYPGGAANNLGDGQAHPIAYIASTVTNEGTVAGTKTYQAGLDLSAAFHRYAVKWEPNKQTYYFDGKEVYSTNVTMTDPMYMVLNLWYGGASGTPDGTTPTGKSNSFRVNYVRAWQFAKAPADSPVTSPNPIPTPTLPPAPAPESPPVTETPPAPVGVVPFGQEANAASYELAFADEFENGFNRSVWNDKMWYETGNPTINYAVEGGSLKIWPQRDANGKFFKRTIDTDGKYYQKYGYFEIDAKLPAGHGTWPAFWLFNHINERRPEMDIMEAYGGGEGWGFIDSKGIARPTVYAPTVWRGDNDQNPYLLGTRMYETGHDLSSGFHKYAVKWEPNKQTYYFDGKEVLVLNISMADPMYIMLDLWQGSAAGMMDDRTPTGKTNSFEIKYVRAWKFK